MSKKLTVLIGVATLSFVTGSAFAGFVGHPATGAAIVTHGKFTNVYVYPNSDRQTWDEHLAALPPSLKPTEDFSRARIDRFTADLMSGWPGTLIP